MDDLSPQQFLAKMDAYLERRSVIDRTKAHLLACLREIGADAVAEKLEH